MKFRAKIDTTFEAEDIDDAFWVLALHFLELARSGHSQLEHVGSFAIAPADDFTERADA
jgi:hypothetical protein